jgi:phosphoglycolate phosphatase
MYSHVIWDWNGTLLDDVNWCLKILNTMLAKRNKKTVGSVAGYHAVFCFPIIDYYRNVGFDYDKEPYEDLAEEFMELYLSNKTGNCKLHQNAVSVLESIKNAGIIQVVLSASKMSVLQSQMNEFDIIKYFDKLLGLTDIYAHSKVDIGLKYIKNESIERAVLIGDSKHDYEVAQAIGVDCILIPNGHQSRETLQSCGVPVLDDITDVVGFIRESKQDRA